MLPCQTVISSVCVDPRNDGRSPHTPMRSSREIIIYALNTRAQTRSWRNLRSRPEKLLSGEERSQRREKSNQRVGMR
ncbi:hypothetical protein NQZ68_012174 [Dissostichus eleginoides]|nr:hypothetical protein NQZ68_012174 [Dissostichus eleginoides]